MLGMNGIEYLNLSTRGGVISVDNNYMAQVKYLLF